MSYEMNFSSSENILIRQTAGEFYRSVILLESLPEELYQKIGGHIRHNLDFVNLFLQELETGIIDYSKRERNELIEENRTFAIEQIQLTISKLQDLSETALSKTLLVCSELDQSIRHITSAMRELEFLHSHTVHHHALIAEKLSKSGWVISADFGVAPSTLEFWKKRGKAA